MGLRNTPVVLYSENPLALRYLEGLLQARWKRKLCCGSSLAPRLESADASIFIADQGTLEVTRRKTLNIIKDLGGSARVLVIGPSNSTSDLCRLILVGVHGFVQYKDVVCQLDLALEAIRDGRLWMPLEAVEGFARSLATKAKLKGWGSQPLTLQEETVLKLLSRSLSNKEISVQLHISERTVKFHLSNIFNKLGVRDRYSAVHLSSITASVELTKTSEKEGPLV